MITTMHVRQLPAAAGNKLYLDYISGSGSAGDYYAYGPLAFAAAYQARQAYTYPRQKAALRLAAYNAAIDASPRVQENVKALGDPSTFCVITGQQAGFLGGPAYTAYKIVTSIRLAAHLEAMLGTRCVPVFWLASEDHDFGEINHTYYLRHDGEVGRVSFGWEQEGHPVADLAIGKDVRRAYDEYLKSMVPGPYVGQLEQCFGPRTDESYCAWQARMWSHLFSEQGLVVVEPRTLRPLAGQLYRSVLQNSKEVRHRLDEVSERMAAAGYEPALTSAQAGQLYTFDAAGRRVRVTDPQEHILEAANHPERYSTDAALRPLLADAVLPVLASVLGPGEIAYQGMLKPLYDLFNVHQPLLFPRKSYTVVAKREAGRIARYRTSVDDILTERLDVDAKFSELVPESESRLFAVARRELEAAFSPLRSHLESIDPSLGKTWAQTVANSARNMDKLEARTLRARMNQLGFRKGELQALRNALMPRGRLQERVLPLPHFINAYGKRFIDEVLTAGALDDFAHHILTLEDERAGR